MNVIAGVLLYNSYRSTGKSYLLLAVWAVVVESTRQLPDGFIPFYPEQNSVYVVSILLQASAALLFLFALMRLCEVDDKSYKLAAATFIGAIIGVAAIHSLTGLPTSTGEWYFVYSPVLIITLATVVFAKKIANKSTTSRKSAVYGSALLFLLRFWLPGIESFDLIEIIYYIEVLVFPFLAATLTLSEFELAHQRIKNLLADRTRTIKELQFVFDNSMDTILITDKVGLLLSWNDQAEKKLGYTAEQAIGKIHIDELFADNYWHRNTAEKEVFPATMEAADGSNFPVTARMQTVVEDDLSRTIYVIQHQGIAKPQSGLM